MRYHQIFRFVSTNHQMDVHFLKTITGVQWSMSPSNTRITRSPKFHDSLVFLSGKNLYKSGPLNSWKPKTGYLDFFVLGRRPWYCCFNSLFNYAWDLPILFYNWPWTSYNSNITDFSFAWNFTPFLKRRLSTGALRNGAPFPGFF